MQSEINKMSTLTRAQKIEGVALLLVLDSVVTKAQINLLKLESKIEHRRLKEKWLKWIDT